MRSFARGLLCLALIQGNLVSASNDPVAPPAGCAAVVVDDENIVGDAGNIVGEDPKSKRAASGRARRARWDPALIVLIIQGLPETSRNPAAVESASGELLETIRRLANNPAVTGNALLKAGRRHFGSWDEALAAAGFDAKAAAAESSWDRALVLRVLQALPPGSLGASAIRNAPETINATIRRVTGYPMADGAALYQAARRYYTSWAAALTAAGRDPRRTLRRTPWDRAMVLRAMAALDPEELAASAVGAAMTAETAAKITLATGYPNSTQLYAAAQRHFGSWEDALRAAGHDPAHIRLVIPWTPALVLKALAVVNLEELSSLASTALPPRELQERMRRALGLVPEGTIDIYQAACRKWGSWEVALRQAGFDPRAARSQVPWTREMVLQALATLTLEQLSELQLGLGSPEAVRAVLREITGYPNAGVDLYKAARRHFGSWEAALWAAAIDPATLRTSVAWDRAKIIQLVQTLREERLPLGATTLVAASPPRVHDLLRARFGPNATPLRLVRAGAAVFGSWTETLAAAGVPAQQARLLTGWDGERLVASIRALRTATISLEEAVISRDTSSTTRKLLQPIVGHEASGRELHAVAVLFFGTWEDAVAFATLPGRALTRDQVMRAVVELHRAGVSIDRTGTLKGTSPRALSVLQATLGTTATLRDLYHSGVLHFDSWRNTIRVSGLPVFPQRNDHTNSRADRDRLIVAIRALRESGSTLRLPLTLEGPQNEVLRRLFGRALTGPTLYMSARLAFGSWPDALRASGINPAEVMSHWRWSRDSVLAAIVRLAHTGIPLQEAALSADLSLATREHMVRLLHRSETGRTLYLAALDFFGSWTAALTAAGLLPNAAPVLRCTEEKATEAFRALHEAGLPLGELDLLAGRVEETVVILRRVFERNVTGAQFYHGARRAFEAEWVPMLERAGLNMAQVRARVAAGGRIPSLTFDGMRARRATALRLDKDQIRTAIEALRAADVPIHSGAMRAAKTEAFEEALRGVFPWPITPPQLLRAATAEYEDWNAALRACDIDPYELDIPGRWSRAKVRAAIELFDANGLALNAAAVSDSTEADVLGLLGQVLGRAVTSGVSLYNAGRALYGSWDEALRAAGVDPGTTRRTHARRGNLSLVPTSMENDDSGDFRRNVRYIGSAPESPERAMEENAFHELIEEALETIESERDRAIARAFIEGILMSENPPGADMLAELIQADIGGTVTTEDVQRVMGLLAGTDALARLLRELRGGDDDE